MDVAGSLPLDHRGIVIGDPQLDLDAELLRQKAEHRGPAIGDGVFILGGHHGEIDLLVFGPPVRRDGQAWNGGRGTGRKCQNKATADHDGLSDKARVAVTGWVSGSVKAGGR